jgi:hypothetical protein
LEEDGIISKDYEFLHEVGLIIGGTEDQSLHHDISRQFASWTKNDTKKEDEYDRQAGWEVNRLNYNEAMSSPFAPSSILLALGSADDVFLGIQRNEVDFHG